MARYEYKCEPCQRLEVIDKPMKEASKIEYCGQCGKELKKVYGATQAIWKTGGSYAGRK